MSGRRSSFAEQWARGLIGRLVSGRYELRALIGCGGIGAVFHAYDHTLRREVAVKTLLPHLDEPEHVERFLVEARTMAAMHHPNVVTVHDVLEVHGRPWMVMELLHGESLQDRLSREKRLPPRQALTILQAVASALDHAHSHNLVHRDVKPANIFLERSGRVVLLDFGLVRVLGSGRRTPTGMRLGTPGYMAPEQMLRPWEVGPATDVYALGVVAYQLLAGRRPFEGASFDELWRAHMEAPVPRPGNMPTPVYRVLARALEKKPGRRYRRAGEFVEALERALAGRASAVGARFPGRLGRRAVALVAVVVLTAVSLVVAGGWLSGDRSAPGRAGVAVLLSPTADGRAPTAAGVAVGAPAEATPSDRGKRDLRPTSTPVAVVEVVGPTSTPVAAGGAAVPLPPTSTPVSLPSTPTSTPTPTPTPTPVPQQVVRASPTVGSRLPTPTPTVAANAQACRQWADSAFKGLGAPNGPVAGPEQPFEVFASAPLPEGCELYLIVFPSAGSPVTFSGGEWVFSMDKLVARVPAAALPGGQCANCRWWVSLVPAGGSGEIWNSQEKVTVNQLNWTSQVVTGGGSSGGGSEGGGDGGTSGGVEIGGR